MESMFDDEVIRPLEPRNRYPTSVNKEIKRLQAEEARSQAKRWPEYEALRKKDKFTYLSPSVQSQMQKDIEALGAEAFGLPDDE